MRSLFLFTSFLIAAPMAAHAADPALDRHVLQYYYQSDPVKSATMNATFCKKAGFEANAYFEGPISTYALDPVSGEVIRRRIRKVGHAKACVQLQDFSFTPFGPRVPVYWEVHVRRVGNFVAKGYCTPSNNDAPEAGIILGGCVLDLTSGPTGFVGGNMGESGVLLNPFGNPDYELSSSFLTFHYFNLKEADDDDDFGDFLSLLAQLF